MGHVFTSSFAEVEIPDVAVHDFVLAGAGDHPDRTAVIDGPSGRSYTYGQLAGMIRSFAGGLVARGFSKGDVLAIVAPNIPEYAVVFHGTTMAGGTVTTVNPTYGAEEIGAQLEDARASIVVTVGMFLDTVRQAASKGSGIDVYTFDAVEGAEQFTSLLAAPLEEGVEVNPSEDIAVLPYSSGTTGLPKGVMLTHRNLVANILQTKVGIDFGDDEVVIAVLPFFHIYGMQVLMNGMLQHGGTVVTMPRFDLEQFLTLIQEHRVTRAFVVPPIVLALAKHPLVDQYDVSSLKQVFSGAAPLGADLAAAATERMGVEVVQGYGLTETSPVTNVSPPGRARAGTVGVLVPNIEMRIVDPVTGEDQGPGGEGEVWFRGPNIMKGYLGRASDTAAMIDAEGWLHTGDIGVADDEGYLKITDRLKELIKFKGFQVPPAELEALLLTHPSIADCAVIGVPDDEAGELPKAFVVPAPGATLGAEEVKAFSAEHLATYKQVRLVEFIDEIPKSLSGKILRRELRDRDRTA